MSATGVRARPSDDRELLRHPVVLARAEFEGMLACRHEYGRDMLCVRCSLPFNRIQLAQIWHREFGRPIHMAVFRI